MSGMADLLESLAPVEPVREALAPGAVLLRGRALPVAAALLAAVDSIAAQAPFRRMVTPGGFEMSVAMTNCGAAGWVTDRRGYRYDRRDPASGLPWPPMPALIHDLAAAAAAEAGFSGFDYYVFYGVMVPAGTPDAIVGAVNSAIDRVLLAPDMRKALTERGVDVRAGTPRQFYAFLARERAKWSVAVKESGATVD